MMKNYLFKDKLLKQKSQDSITTYYALVCIFSVILFYLGVLTRFTTDYNIHTKTMANLSISPLLNPLNWPNYFADKGYPLWFICGKAIMRILSCPPNYAAGICTGGFLVLSYIGVLTFYKYKFGEKANNNLIALLTFILFIVGPIWLPWRNKYIILGCGGPNIWHNATNICGRAIGIYAFYYSMKLLDTIIDSGYKDNPKLKQWIGLAFLYFLSLLAKPSFAQSFVPAFAIVLIYYLIKSQGRFLKPFLCFIGCAALPFARLLWMYLYYYGDKGIANEKTGESLIILMPSAATTIHILKIQILVLLFPLLIFILSVIYKKITRYHLISFLMYLFSLIYILILKGSAAGEMGWCYYIAVFFVFLVSLHDYILHFFVGKEIFNYRIGQSIFILFTVVLSEHCIVGLYYLFQLIVMGNPRF